MKAKWYEWQNGSKNEKMNGNEEEIHDLYFGNQFCNIHTVFYMKTKSGQKNLCDKFLDESLRRFLFFSCIQYVV